MVINTRQPVPYISLPEKSTLSAIDRLHQVAEHYGLTCLSTEWHGRYASYTFRCKAAGHEMVYRGGTVLHASATCRECDDACLLTQIEAVAQEKGGECLEDRYLPNTPLRFICAAGHRFSSKGRAVLRGIWCHTCAVRRYGQKALREDGYTLLKEITARNGGVCLEDKYLGRFARHRFRCAQGHEWETDAGVVFSGGWCKICGTASAAKKKSMPDGLQRLQALAIGHGGKCLSTAYTKSRDFFRFRCKAGHEWDMKGTYVLKGQWCKACSNGKKRIGIERMHEIAHERGGFCLSMEYVNNHMKLQWQCHRGHVWATTPACIRRGNWCPDCARLRQITNRKSKAGLNYVESTRHHRDAILERWVFDGRRQQHACLRRPRGCEG